MSDQNKETLADTAGSKPISGPLRQQPDRLPGRRDALPPGALGDGLPADPQGDENRQPPANAPTIPE